MTNSRPSPSPVPSHVLLSVASHELRGPVGVARGYLRLLEQDPAQPERSQRAIRGAADALERVVGVLDEMREYSRLTRGELRLEIRPASWAELLDSVTRDASLPTTPDLVWQRGTAAPEGDVPIDRNHIEGALVVLANTLARAQTTECSLSITVRYENRPDRRPVLEILSATPGPNLNLRPADLTRAGIGLSLVLADAMISAHGAWLSECWQDGTWVGYRVQGLG